MTVSNFISRDMNRYKVVYCLLQKILLLFYLVVNG